MISAIIKKLIFLNQLLKQIGFNFILLKNIFLIFKFIKDFIIFKKLKGTVYSIYPFFSDYKDNAGVCNGHYFHQDRLVASYIFNQNPKNHLDIGSRIDGFVSAVSIFREINVMDIRDLSAINIRNIKFIKNDLMSDNSESNIKYDSISCLHAIEHFGLGRYGDNVDPLGHIKGIKNIMKLLEDHGSLYISFPITHEKNQVYFNAHRVFNFKDIFTWLESVNIKLIQFDFVDDNGDLHTNIEINKFPLKCKYGLGIYTFKKIKLLEK